jgi:hypothetical protein
MFGVLVASAASASTALAAGTLSVSVQGGPGNVTGTGINCDETGGPDCSEFYPDDQDCDPERRPPCFNIAQDVTVTAANRVSGFTFQGWTGCGSVSGNDCTVNMSVNRNVTASFGDTANPSVGLTGPSAGSVLTGSVAVGANASDNVGVSRVEFLVGTTQVANDTSSPFGLDLNTTSFSDGAKTITARAFDPSGNSSTSSRNVTFDNTAPGLTITSGPDGQTFGPGTTQMWDFIASDATSGVQNVQCSVVATGSAPSFGACTGGSLSHSVSSVPDGTYTFSVRAADGGGLQTTQARTFAIDADPPDTTLTKTPLNPSVRRRAVFRFIADEPGATFQCSLDGAAFETCVSPYSKRVALGRHSLKVRAIDTSGNVEATPARFTWRVKPR